MTLKAVNHILISVWALVLCSCYLNLDIDDRSGSRSSTVASKSIPIHKITATNPSGYYSAMTVIELAIEFAEPVMVTGDGNLYLELNTQPTPKRAKYLSGSGGTILRFTYAIEDGDFTPLLEHSSTNALILGDNTQLKTMAGENAMGFLPEPGTANTISDSKQIVIDTTAPSVSAVDPPEIPTGTGASITLTGQHFTQDMTITINGTNCSQFQFINQTTVSCFAAPFSVANLSVDLGKSSTNIVKTPPLLQYRSRLPSAPLCFDKPVDAIESTADKLFIGGSFTNVGTCSGSGVPLDINSGLLKLPVGQLPTVVGNINAVIPDQSGGYFIAGPFTSVGGQDRNGLARILSDGTIDDKIGVYTKFNGAITTIAFDHTQKKLYVGGDFKSEGTLAPTLGGLLNLNTAKPVAGQRPLIAISSDFTSVIGDGVGGFFVAGRGLLYDGVATGDLIHISSGGQKVLAFAPEIKQAGVGGIVNAMVLLGTTLYIGGAFNSVNGQTRNGLAALDISNGGLLSWNPGLSAAGLSYSAYSVDAMVLTENNTLIVGGNFSQVGGQARLHLAELSLADGQPTVWNPSPNGRISALALYGTDLIIAAGLFTQIGGQASQKIAAIERSSGALNPLLGQITGSDNNSLLVYNSTLFIGGWGFSFGGESYPGLGAVDLTNGQAKNWKPFLRGEHETSMALWNGRLIFMGGFAEVDGIYQDFVAHFDAETLELMDWIPGLIRNQGAASIYSAGAISADNVFVGYFGLKSMLGNRRYHLAAIDTATGLLNSFDIDADEEVQTLKLVGTTLYVGGKFRRLGYSRRNQLGAIDVSNNSVTDFNPNVTFPYPNLGGIWALEMFNNVLYVGGQFDAIGNQPRKNIAAVNASTGALLDWYPAGGANNPVKAISASAGGVFIGGEFSAIGSQSRNGLGLADVSSGIIKPWESALPAGSVVKALATRTNSVFVGGRFRIVSPVQMNNLASFDIGAGSLLPWNPNLNDEVNAIALDADTLYAGGNFSSLEMIHRNYVAIADPTSGQLLADDLNIAEGQMGVRTFLINNGILYVGGGFTRVQNQNRSLIVAFNLQDLSLYSWPSSLLETAQGSFVKAIEIDPVTGQMFVAGLFTEFGGQARTNLASFDLNTGLLSGLSFDIDGRVDTLKVIGTKLFVGGTFNGLNGTSTGRRLFAVNLSNNQLNPWNPKPDPTVFALAGDSSGLVVGGSFIYITGLNARFGLGAFDPNTLLLTNWAPFPQFDWVYSVNSLLVIGSNVIVGGRFSKINMLDNSGNILPGNAVYNLVRVDRTTGVASDWTPNVNGEIYSMHAHGDTLYIGGSFSFVDGQYRNSFSAVSLSTGSRVGSW
jgi:hypothetical protein